MSLKTRISDGGGTSKEAEVRPPGEVDPGVGNGLLTEVRDGKIRPRHQVKTGYYPELTSQVSGDYAEPTVDADGTAETRSAVLTDEGAFRHQFHGGNASLIDEALTGTVTFVGGSTVVKGYGTAFLDEVVTDQYIRLNTDATSVYTQVKSVISDEEIELWEGYLGSSLQGTAVISDYFYSVAGAASALTYTDPSLDLTPGTANGGSFIFWHDIDYLPIAVTIRASIDQRIANQTILMGLQNTADNVGSFVHIIFDGTSANTITFRTGISPTEFEDSTIILSNKTTDQQIVYDITVLPNQIVFSVDKRVKATHTKYVPLPYEVLGFIAEGSNDAAVTATTLSIFEIYNSNLNLVAIASPSSGAPIPVEIITDSSTTAASEGFVRGWATVSTTAQTAVRRTTYTLQSTDLQISLASSSASDAAAGTGARTIKITYYDQNLIGPFEETITLNGTSRVASTNTNICHVEKMEVVTVGSTGATVGIVSIYDDPAAGAAFGSISASDTSTQWCHHFVGAGVTCRISSVTVGNSGDQTAKDSRFVVKHKALLTANAVDDTITEIMRIPGFASPYYRGFDTPVVVGPGQIVLYTTNGSASSYDVFGAISFTEE